MTPLLVQIEHRKSSLLDWLDRDMRGLQFARENLPEHVEEHQCTMQDHLTQLKEISQYDIPLQAVIASYEQILGVLQ